MNAVFLGSTRNVELDCIYAKKPLKYDHITRNTYNLRYKSRKFVDS